MSISYTRHNKGSEKYYEVKLWEGGGGVRGAYLAHGLKLLLSQKGVDATIEPYNNY